MIRSALVCTDGSPYAKVALTYARHWAERMGLRLRVLFVEDLRLTQGPLVTGYYGPVGMAPSPAYPAFYDDLVKTVKEQGERTMAEAREGLAGVPTDVDYVVREGIVNEVILDEARNADMVIMGRRGEHGEWENDELGATVHRVVRRSQRPVLVTPAQFRTLDRLMVAYDRSGPANRALRVACDLASDAGLPMTVLTIAESESRRAQADAALAEARNLARGYEEVEVLFESLIGEATEDLLVGHAGKNDVSMIVMGAYGESRIREWLLGSTTSGVLVKTELPVLLIR